MRAEFKENRRLMRLTVSKEGTPRMNKSSTLRAVISPRNPKASRPSNAISKTALTKGITRTDSGPALCSLPKSFRKIQMGANSSELNTSKQIANHKLADKFRNSVKCLTVSRIDHDGVTSTMLRKIVVTGRVH